MHGPEVSALAGWDDSSADERGDGVIRRTWKVPAESLWEDPTNTRRGGLHQPGQRLEDAFEDADYFNHLRANTIDFVGEEEDTYEEIDAIDQLVRKSGPEDERTSTITPSEKHAFQKIFSDIFARSQQAQQASHLDPFDEEAPELPNIDEAKEMVSEEKDRKLHDIMRQAVAQSREQKEAAVNRYPAPLRAAAARAIGLKLDAGPMLLEANTMEEDIFFNNRLEELRKPERTRVECLMQGAKTDFEMWAIMEKEVFPLISRLGLSDSKEEYDTPTPKRKTKNLKGARKQTQKELVSKSSSTTSAPLLESPEDGISALALYGPLYPSYLLLGLRLLDRSFSKPSPLTLSLLPKIKSLGLISHVLGASTQFYNELLVISWYRYDDFMGAEALLKEMEQSGLDWDAETLKVVRNIADIQTATLRGDRGIYLKALWSLPEFAPRKFRPWKEKIQQSLDQRDPDVFLAY
jgi:hypothetical protein